MQQRQLGPFSVSAIGLGCMNICHAYGTASTEAEAERLLLAALDAGVTHFDTAALLPSCNAIAAQVGCTPSQLV